jgi:hypothetical protein
MGQAKVKKQNGTYPKEVATPTSGFLVRKKCSFSEEWNYFAGETDFAYMWSPASARPFTVAIFPTRQAAERMVKQIEDYHKERHREGKTSGFDVSVEEWTAPSQQ